MLAFAVPVELYSFLYRSALCGALEDLSIQDMEAVYFVIVSLIDQIGTKTHFLTVFFSSVSDLLVSGFPHSSRGARDNT